MAHVGVMIGKQSNFQVFEPQRSWDCSMNGFHEYVLVPGLVKQVPCNWRVPLPSCEVGPGPALLASYPSRLMCCDTPVT